MSGDKKVIEVNGPMILAAREERSRIQECLLLEHGNNLISMTMNIPGPVKNSQVITKAFRKSFMALLETLEFEGFGIDHTGHINNVTGPLGFISLKGDSRKLKLQLILFEESNPLGRLLDIDLVNHEEGVISRASMGIDTRKCFLCREEANICRRMQRHSYKELMTFVNRCLDDYVEKADEEADHV